MVCALIHAPPGNYYSQSKPYIHPYGVANRAREVFAN